MAKATINAHLVDETAPNTEAVNINIDNLPAAPAAPGNATTSAAGLVKQAAAIDALADGAELAAAVAKINEILTKGKAAGFLS